ncbi:MAG TPA: glycosyltransferase family A protein [Candidatus Saccharimonadales bacterium]|nr:glycosyltransferase family A protein [Candidatus Saccharimonadales bacterium]
MIETLLIQLSVALLGASIVAGVTIILTATWYDLRGVARRQSWQTIAATLRKPRQPHIAVMVYAHNNATTIQDCLRSISCSRYKNYHVMVVDNVSTDTTKQAVLHYQRKRTKKSVSLYAKRKTTDRLTALRLGYKKTQPNDLVFILDATDTITPNLLKDAATRFVANNRLDALRLQHYNDADINLSLLVYQFMLLSTNLYNKAISPLSLSIRPSDIGDAGIFLRSTIFKNKTLPTKLSSCYASDLLFTRTESVATSLTIPTTNKQKGAQRHRRNVPTIIGASFLLLVAITMTYFFYTAATLQSHILLTLSWLVVSLWLFTATWSNDQMTMSKKIELTFCIPVMYILLYVQLAVQIFTMLVRTLPSATKLKLTLQRSIMNFHNNIYSTR